MERDLRIVKKNKIGLNEATNGVYLPIREATKNDGGAWHHAIHTGPYYSELYKRLIDYNGDPEGIKDGLNDAAEQLKNNTFPY